MPIAYRKRKATAKSTKKSFKKRKVSKKVSKKTFKRSSKKSSLNGRAQRVGNAHWLSFGKAVKFTRKPFIGRLSKILAPSFYYINNVGTVTVGAGTQSPVTVGTTYSTADIINCLKYTWEQQFKLGAEAATGYTGPTTNTCARTLLESCTEKLMLTNQSNAPAYIDVYDIVSRRDTKNASVDLPTAAWTGGITDETGPTLTVTNSFVGSTPFAVELFTQYFKVLKITRINLAAGESAEHVRKTQPMRLWNDEIDQYLTNIRNLTHYCMIVPWGAACDNDNTTVSTSNVKIDYVYTKQYRSSALADNHTLLAGTNNIGTAAGHVTNVGSGVDVAVANA